MSDGPSDHSAIDQMRAGVDAAHAAADRLVREAEEQARARAAAAEEAIRAATGGIPPGGWASPGSRSERSEQARGAGAEAADLLKALMKLLDMARELARESVPPELTAQLAQALRELLLAVRALIDWYVERLDAPIAPAPRPAHPGDVEDIPIT